MTHGSNNDLSQDLGELSETFSNLGERLLGAARQLHAPGAPPPEGLIDELGQARRAFVSLRDRTTERATALHVALPSAETLDTIQGLTAVLDLVVEAEIRQVKAEETRRRAAAVLNRVLSIEHSGEGGFVPLRDCQEHARTLRDTVMQGSWTALPPEAEPLSEGDHPFAHLLAFVEGRETLDDDLWTSLHDTIGTAFGKSLAVAAARAKLVLPAGPSEVHHGSSGADTPQSPVGDTRSDRANFRQATSTSTTY